MSEDMIRLYIVRHGETAANTEMRYLGMRDDPLTENGRRQAIMAANALAQLPFSAIITSPLRRAADTAAEIQKATGAMLRMDRRLLEISFGTWEGLSRNEVLQLGGKDVEMLSRWENDASCAPPGGESLQEVQRRIILLIKDLEAEFPGTSVMLVSHVSPIKALLASALQMPLQDSRRLFLDPCTISVIDWNDPPLLRLFNSHAHMGWQSARWMKTAP
jgi:broad specificity phosphatase PhoE